LPASEAEIGPRLVQTQSTRAQIPIAHVQRNPPYQISLFNAKTPRLQRAKDCIVLNSSCPPRASAVLCAFALNSQLQILANTP
jgi:hypothetical protein